MSVSLCVTFVVFTDRESCTRPISTNSGSMEAGEYGLTRGTCFLACGLELDAVAGLLWISWCVLGGADFSVNFFFRFFFFERTRPAASMRPPCLIYLSTSSGHSRTAVPLYKLTDRLRRRLGMRELWGWYHHSGDRAEIK